MELFAYLEGCINHLQGYDKFKGYIDELDSKGETLIKDRDGGKPVLRRSNRHGNEGREGRDFCPIDRKHTPEREREFSVVDR